MKGRRNPFVAQEGLPLLLLAAAVIGIALRYAQPWAVVFGAVLLLFLYMLFRDPHRVVPAAPLGVVSPVDGKIVCVDQIERGRSQGTVLRIRIRIDLFGTYTARCPVEGKIKDPRSIAADGSAAGAGNSLWVQTDEGDDVLLQFSGYRLGLAPRALRDYGERLGQGERCAYLRLTRFAEVLLPVTGQVLVHPGQIVVAGADLIAQLPRPRV